MASITIRPYQKGDEFKIQRLFRLAFGKELDLEVWRWKFMQNPLGYGIMLAFCGDELVAQCAGVPVRFKVNNQKVMGMQIVDCMSHPSYRGIAFRKKGVFALTTEAFFDRYTGCDKHICLYGFPSHRHYLLGRLLLGYRRISPAVEVLVKPKYSFWHRLIYRVREVKPEELQKREIVTLVERPPAHFLIGPVKDFAYFKWRYIDIPHVTYRFFLVSKPLTGCGLAVVRDAGSDAMYMLDCFGDIDFGEISFALACELKKPILMWLPNNKAFLKLLRGEVELEEPKIKPVPVARSFCKKKVPWDTLKNLFYMQGDSDLF